VSLTRSQLGEKLRLPVFGAPMFLVSGPGLVIAQCRAGILGVMPALNVRDPDRLGSTLAEIREALSGEPAAPFGVNLIAHASNQRLAHDLEVCVDQRVPLIVTSLGTSEDIVRRIHSYGGLVFHDVTNTRHARKAVKAGVDGIVAVAAGAGGHGGTISPFALCREIRAIHSGPIALAGAISTGSDIAAARAMGADFAYMGTRFIATEEANISDGYAQMLLAATAEDIVYTPHFSGTPGNYLKASIVAAGLDPDVVRRASGGAMQVTDEGVKKAWRDIWSAGHGVGATGEVMPVATLVDRLETEFRAAGGAVGRIWR